MKFAVVGTSHINCFKIACDRDASSLPGTEPPFFFGLNAPILSKQNEKGWPGAPGTLSSDLPEGRAFLARLFGNPDHAFDPGSYDTILLVDMFFCYDFSFLLRDPDDRALRVGNALVSDTTLREILKARLGRSSYGPGSAVGEVRENTVLPLLESIRKAAPQAEIYLAPRPMMPNSEYARNLVRMNAESVVRGARIFDAAANSLLSAMGISFLPRSERLICPESGLTDENFSAGRLDAEPSRLDEHMNGDYGRIVLEDIEDRSEITKAEKAA